MADSIALPSCLGYAKGARCPGTAAGQKWLQCFVSPEGGKDCLERLTGEGECQRSWTENPRVSASLPSIACPSATGHQCLRAQWVHGVFAEVKCSCRSGGRCIQDAVSQKMRWQEDWEGYLGFLAFTSPHQLCTGHSRDERVQSRGPLPVMHLGRSGVAEGIELAHRPANVLEVGSRKAKALGVTRRCH